MVFYMAIRREGDDGFPNLELNDLIHSNWQGNRNPFIDHPEWAQAIWAA